MLLNGATEQCHPDADFALEDEGDCRQDQMPTALTQTFSPGGRGRH